MERISAGTHKSGSYPYRALPLVFTVDVRESVPLRILKNPVNFASVKLKNKFTNMFVNMLTLANTRGII